MTNAQAIKKIEKMLTAMRKIEGDAAQSAALMMCAVVALTTDEGAFLTLAREAWDVMHPEERGMLQ